MKQYPKINYYSKEENLIGENCIGFSKLDGTNVRAEWSKKRGFYKFGTKSIMIDKNSEDFGQTIPLFLEKYNDSISRVFIDKYPKIENFVVFCEYLGENSFSGQHDLTDKMDIQLFDVSQYKRGFITPWEFMDNFGHLDVPKVVYEGKYTEELIENIKQNLFNLKEGVIVKGSLKDKNNKEEVWMVKIKTLEWLKKVRTKFGEKALLLELNNDKRLLDI